MIHRRMVGLTLLALLSWTAAPAQQATEVYIPIGESPGISGSKSLVGPIVAVEHEQHRMVVSTAEGARTVAMTTATLYYIDNTGDKARNETGSYTDCEVGRYVEANVGDNGEAIWVKIAKSE